MVPYISICFRNPDCAFRESEIWRCLGFGFCFFCFSPHWKLSFKWQFCNSLQTRSLNLKESPFAILSLRRSSALNDWVSTLVLHTEAAAVCWGGGRRSCIFYLLQKLWRCKFISPRRHKCTCEALVSVVISVACTWAAAAAASSAKCKAQDCFGFFLCKRRITPTVDSSS